MSFTDIGKVAADRDSAISADIPSFVRLNQTFGEHASAIWLYTHLKSLLVRFLVDEKKMSDEQVEETFVATLCFPDSREDRLMRNSRTLSVHNGETQAQVLLNALLAGPQAGEKGEWPEVPGSSRARV